MKNLLLLLLVGVFAFTSCSKDDEDQLAGTWEGVSQYSKITYEGETMEDTHTFTNEDRPTLTLNENNTYTMRTYDDYDEEWEVETGTYSVSGNKITVDNEQTFDFTVSRSQLVLSDQGTENGETYEFRMTFRRK